MDQIATIFMVFGGMWIISGIGITVFIMYKILDKYINYGDSSGDIHEFAVGDIDYIRYIDEVSQHERTLFNDNFSIDPYEDIKRSVPEPLKKEHEM
ncbi:MAG: hypothetical protein J5685_12900 [Clostridiales bacterium]|nr:hypothetical protein [Clostridiales bacterium]